MSIFEYNQEQHFRQIAEENMEAGKAEGRAEGQKMATLANLKTLMESMGLTVEQALNVLKIPLDNREEYRNLLK